MSQSSVQFRPPVQISVVCPVYNTPPALLREAVQSVLGVEQPFAVQLILSDDGSNDKDTLKALADLEAADDRVQVLRASANRGPANARNRGIAAATGEWIAFLDSDDLWLGNHLHRLAAVLEAAPDARWMATNHALLARSGQQTPSADFSDAHEGEVVAPGVVRFVAPASTRALIGNFWLHLGGCVVAADIVRQAGGLDESCIYGEDWLFAVRLSLCADLYYVPEPTYLLRRQHASLMTSSRRLTIARAGAHRAALRARELRHVRRELRWALRSIYKGLAATNLLAGHRRRAAWFALRALALDPRELDEAARFASFLRVRDRARLREQLPAYSVAELDGAAHMETQ